MVDQPSEVTLLTKLLLHAALGFAFGVMSCGSDDPDLVTGAGDDGGGTAGTDGTGPGSGGSSNVGASGDANDTGHAGASTGGTTTTGVGGSGNTGTGGAAHGGSAGSGGGGGGSAGSGGAAMGGHAGSGGAAGGGGHAGSGGAAGGGGTFNACTPTAPLPAGTSHCSSNANGNVGGGYSWTIWSSGAGACVIPYGVGAAFKATWNESGDLVARVGLALGSNRTSDQIGTFAADYAETKAGTNGGYSFIGIYGWSVEPLHEYYIVDDWFGSRPQYGEKVGEITVDGGTYDILTHTQVNQPAIGGMNATFVQFWSMRQTARQCGHISISEHFKAWAKLGMTLGKMEECKIVVEVGGGNGSIDFTTATMTAK